jgi:hypothetical protein
VVVAGAAAAGSSGGGGGGDALQATYRRVGLDSDSDSGVGAAPPPRKQQKGRAAGGKNRHDMQTQVCFAHDSTSFNIVLSLTPVSAMHNATCSNAGHSTLLLAGVALLRPFKSYR